MTYERFDKLLEKMIEEEKAIGTSKGKEYTQGDRLDNFKRLSKDIDITPKQVLWVFLKKHLDSISRYIKVDAEPRKMGDKLTLTEPIQGRIMDARVYLSLLRALIEEEESPIKEVEQK